MAGIWGYKPTIVADTSKPEGVSDRYAEITRMSAVGKPAIRREEGLRRVLVDVRQRLKL